MTAPDSPAVDARQFKCTKCGARLEFAPGVDALSCPYCGTRNEIARTAERVEELDVAAALARARDDADAHEILTVKCKECGSETTLPRDVVSAPCPFCGSGLVSTAASRKAIKPGAVLPFRVTRDAAQDSYAKWLGRLWFAPNDVKRVARLDGALSGVYVPYWTFDCETTTDYVGERGDYFYTTETYTETVNGRSETRTRQVRHIRWSPAGGTVENSFDDLLVRATSALPSDKLEALEPWDLENLVAYRDEYLAGFRADSYQIDLAGGFEVAQKMMDGPIETTCREDIGGDEQRVLRKDVAYRDIKFKHVLFPVWISAYRYRDKVFRVLVNARTGEVQGERPYSAAKIVLTILGAVAAIVAVVALASR